MWNYFYSHPVCWYKVLHLSQSSFGWAVEVKAELLRVVAAQLARWLARANINSARPGAVWQLHHHRLLATSWGFQPPNRESWASKGSPRKRRNCLLANVVSRTPKICPDVFSPHDFPTFIPNFPMFSPSFSNVFSAHLICCSQLLLLERLMRNCLFSLGFCSTLNARCCSSYWIAVYADKSSLEGAQGYLFVLFSPPKKLFKLPVISRTRLLLP